MIREPTMSRWSRWLDMGFRGHLRRREGGGRTMSLSPHP